MNEFSKHLRKIAKDLQQHKIVAVCIPVMMTVLGNAISVYMIDSTRMSLMRWLRTLERHSPSVQR